MKEKPLYNHYNFDPVVLAWNVDPLTHRFPSESPYSAFGNNPIYNIDVDGAFKYPADEAANYRKEFPILTLYLEKYIKNDVMKSKLLSEEIINFAKNPEFSSYELFNEILVWGKDSRTTIKFDKEQYGNANTVNSKNITINWDYAKAIENILSDKEKVYTVEDKLMALTAFFITLMDETTLAGEKYRKNPLTSEGGSDGDVGNDLTNKLFYSKDGWTAVNRIYQADKNYLEGTKVIVKTLLDECKEELLPTVPTVE